MDTKKKGKKGSSAYDAALTYLTARARTVREVELKLDEGDYSEAEIIHTIERLVGAGLLNDQKYARDFIESRLNTKPVSKFRLASQLRSHHVPDDIIEAALDELPAQTELKNAIAVAEKYMRQFAKMDDSEEKDRRIYARLATRGYPHELIKTAMREYCDNITEIE